MKQHRYGNNGKGKLFSKGWSTGILLTILLAWGSESTMAENGCDEEPVLDLASLGIGGTASLCQTPGGLKAHLRATGLMPGEAYTVWWIYIDDPTQCVPDPDVPPEFACDYSFFFNDGDPLAVLGRFDSGVAPGSGKLHFKDALNGLQASQGAMVWLFIMAHGAAAEDGRARARQLLTPEDPIFGVPHLGIIGGELAVPAASSFHTID